VGGRPGAAAVAVRCVIDSVGGSRLRAAMVVKTEYRAMPTLYNEVHQVAAPGGRWLAPPPQAPSPADATPTSQPADTTPAFTAFHRSYPGRSPHDSFVWLQVHSAPLLRSLKALFPALASLYPDAPGSSPGVRSASRARRDRR